MTTSIQFKLGPWDEMADLFSWDSSTGTELTDWIAHGLNQTMYRDGLLGAWTDVYSSPGDTLSVKMSAEFGSVRGYARKIPAFIAAARLGYAAYEAHRSTIEKGKLFFWLPVGLCMLRTRSIQLLHYPPYEARTFADYLYSPTNRRWESLLGSNGYDIEHVTPLERICDAVPLAGPGSDATVINEVEQYFVPYGRAMLAALLDQSKTRTQPVVAYGSPAHDWLRSAYPKQVKRTPSLFSVLQLRVGPGKAVHPDPVREPSERVPLLRRARREVGVRGDDAGPDRRALAGGHGRASRRRSGEGASRGEEVLGGAARRGEEHRGGAGGGVRLRQAVGGDAQPDGRTDVHRGDDDGASAGATEPAGRARPLSTSSARWSIPASLLVSRSSWMRWLSWSVEFSESDRPGHQTSVENPRASGFQDWFVARAVPFTGSPTNSLTIQLTTHPAYLESSASTPCQSIGGGSSSYRLQRAASTSSTASCGSIARAAAITRPASAKRA